jgi:hypothetical protein
MAVKGKKLYRLYLDEKNFEFLRKHLDTTPGKGGVSALVDKYLARCAYAVENNRDLFGEIAATKMGWRKLWQLFQLQTRMSKEWENLKDE